MKDIMWWGYLHANGTVQVKRWFGDKKDYTDDCKDNPFVIAVVEPFKAESHIEAWHTINDALSKMWLPFERATVPESELVRTAKDTVQQALNSALPDKVLAECSVAPRASREDMEQQMLAFLKSRQMDCEVWKNNRYQVAVFDREQELIHLSIKRIDKQPIHDWRDLQRIKNELVGPEHEAVELYPAESRVVDSANQYHLWVFKDPQFRLPFGFKTRFVDDNPVGKAVQRPFDKPQQEKGKP